MAVIREAEIRLLMEKMPACWKDDFKYKSATNILASNAARDAKFAYDQKPESLDDQIDDFFGGARMNGNNRRNGNSRDQEMHEEDPTAAMRGSDPGSGSMMPMRGRPGPAAVWAYGNGGDANGELTPDSLLGFLDAALNTLDEDEKAEFFNRFSEVFDKHNLAMAGSSDNTNATPVQQARAMRGMDRRGQTAQDSALVKQYQSTFYDRHPWARSIRIG